MAPDQNGSNYQDRERPSWREIDQARDRSRHVRPEKSSGEKALKDPWRKQQYLKKAWEGFERLKKGEGHPKALKAIHQAFGTAKFQAKVKEYLTSFGLPEDWSTLLFILDYKDPAWVTKALDALKSLAPSRSVIEKRGLKAKLNLMALTAPDESLQDLAREVAETL
jgi:hypothetical protein